jgi:hypothetical protein
MKANKIMKGQAVSNHRQRKDKKEERITLSHLHRIKPLNN